jgi:hypothetical protein
MIDALRIGLSEAQFWRLTPRRWAWHIEAARRRERDAFERATLQAWQTIRMYCDARGKQGLHPFGRYIGRSRRQSQGELVSALRQLSKQFGGAVTYGE